MRALQLENVIVGQYKGHSKGSKTYPGYTDDPTVPNHSITPTFAAAAIFINNARWDGVPFLMKAGKALHTKRYLKPSSSSPTLCSDMLFCVKLFIDTITFFL